MQTREIRMPEALKDRNFMILIDGGRKFSEPEIRDYLDVKIWRRKKERDEALFIGSRTYIYIVSPSRLWTIIIIII